MAITDARLLSDEVSGDEQVCNLLGQQVARNVLNAVGDDSIVEISPPTRNYYSVTFKVQVKTSGGSRQVFVKIPKKDLRGSSASIFPITAEDRKLAQEEESSLRSLNQSWQGKDLEVNWVKLCAVIPQYNAIITERVFADEALSIFRRLDTRRRFGFTQDAHRLQDIMSRLGAALGRFHQCNAKVSKFRLSEALPKFEFYCREIALSSGSVWPQRIFDGLQSMENLELDGIAVQTLKGVDIRNVMIDPRDRVFLLDPGKMKYTHREADLARFVMTYRILYWGSKWLPLVKGPDRRAESVFLDAYYSHSEAPCPRLLGLYLLKEQLKHWHTALDSLQRLTWSPALKRIVAAVYVNPFYIDQVAKQFQSIAE